MMLLAAFLAFVLFLNATYHFCSDDCVYAVSPLTNALVGNPLTACGLAFSEGYRPVAHAFCRVFTGCFDKSVFNLLNTVMAGLLVLLIGRNARGTWRCDFGSIALTIALVFFILFKGESYLWCAGSCNYLWGGVANLLFFLLLKRCDGSAGARPRRTVLLAWMVVAVFIGWWQESFSLPIWFAIVLMALVRRKLPTADQMWLCGAYGVGTLFLCLVAGQRCETVSSPSVPGMVLNLVKIAAAAKGTWLLAVCLALAKDRRRFIADNAFPLAVVLGSVLMIAAVGFNGERSLWCANLFAVLVIVREVRIGKGAALALTAAVGLVAVLLVPLARDVDRSFRTFEAQYEASPDGVCCHRFVRCGLLGRFFHQDIYRWTKNDGHCRFYAKFRGRATLPTALSPAIYETVYLRDGFCVESNRLQASGAFYSEPKSNTIVMPIPEGTPDDVRFSVAVTYRYPRGFWGKLIRSFYCQGEPQVCRDVEPRRLKTAHGDYLLIGRDTCPDKYIESVSCARTVGGTP